MNILAINGSPRKRGNTAILAEEITKGAVESGHTCNIIYLPDLNIKDCTGCRICQKNGICVIRDDDIEKIETAVKWADVIIFASPTHWGNLSGYMLRMVERLFGFLICERQRNFPAARNAKGKKAILVTACSTAWPFNWIFNQSRAVFSRMNEICRYSGIKIVKKFVLPGTFSIKDIPRRYLEKARRIGKEL